MCRASGHGSLECLGSSGRGTWHVARGTVSGQQGSGIAASKQCTEGDLSKRMTAARTGFTGCVGLGRRGSKSATPSSCHPWYALMQPPLQAPVQWLHRVRLACGTLPLNSHGLSVLPESCSLAPTPCPRPGTTGPQRSTFTASPLNGVRQRCLQRCLPRGLHDVPRPVPGAPQGPCLPSPGRAGSKAPPGSLRPAHGLTCSWLATTAGCGVMTSPSSTPRMICAQHSSSSSGSITSRYSCATCTMARTCGAARRAGVDSEMGWPLARTRQLAVPPGSTSDGGRVRRGVYGACGRQASGAAAWRQP